MRLSLNPAARRQLEFSPSFSPARQLQIDFGEWLISSGGVSTKAFVFVATLGHSRCASVE
jgi:hypothetical protein